MKTSDKDRAPAGRVPATGGQAGEAGKGSGYMGSEVMGCQFSIYPLRQDDVGPAVRDAIAAVCGEGCTVRVGNLSTLLTGSEDQVFSALRAAYRAAQRHGSAVMVATLAAGMPTDELVAEIQDDVAPGAGRGGAPAAPAPAVTPGAGAPAQTSVGGQARR